MTNERHERFLVINKYLSYPFTSAFCQIKFEVTSRLEKVLQDFFFARVARLVAGFVLRLCLANCVRGLFGDPFCVVFLSSCVGPLFLVWLQPLLHEANRTDWWCGWLLVWLRGAWPTPDCASCDATQLTLDSHKVLSPSCKNSTRSPPEKGHLASANVQILFTPSAYIAA